MMAEAKRFFQGVRSFDSYEDYLRLWIKLNMLPDLETVFKGSLKFWEDNQRPSEGRGDFVLATALFSAFDHLGMFLAKHPGESLRSRDNIARTALKLPSTNRIFAIIANLGRNALVHGSWPQTGFAMEGGTWGFGLGIGAPSGRTEHNLIYTRMYPLMSGLPPVKVLKLTQSVHVLRQELDTAIRYDGLWNHCHPDLFERIQRMSIFLGDPFGDENHSRLVNGAVVPGHNMFAGSASFGGKMEVQRQIRGLRRVAEAMGVWEVQDQAGSLDDPELRVARG
jgi:hypothetical protein